MAEARSSLQKKEKSRMNSALTICWEGEEDGMQLGLTRERPEDAALVCFSRCEREVRLIQTGLCISSTIGKFIGCGGGGGYFVQSEGGLYFKLRGLLLLLLVLKSRSGSV